jgi:hypothetical protein
MQTLSVIMGVGHVLVFTRYAAVGCPGGGMPGGAVGGEGGKGGVGGADGGKGGNGGKGGVGGADGGEGGKDGGVDGDEPYGNPAELDELPY